MFRKLLKSLDFPLAAPSANISSKLSSVQVSDVVDEFGSKIKYILDGGKCQIGVESTIINLTSKPSILRLGGLDISKIEKVLKIKVLININSKLVATFFIIAPLFHEFGEGIGGVSFKLSVNAFNFFFNLIFF